MSANLVVDLGATTIAGQSLPVGTTGLTLSGQFAGLSGVTVGGIVDLKDADTFCNIYVGGITTLASGILIIGVQTSDGTTSGSFTDPLSGLAALDRPQRWASGGNLILGSGVTAAPSTGLWGSAISGYNMQSGFMAFAAFQRNFRYARLLFNSGFYIGTLHAGFISNLRTTGSGGGFTLAPGSGTVSV